MGYLVQNRNTEPSSELRLIRQESRNIDLHDRKSGSQLTYKESGGAVLLMAEREVGD